MSGIKKGFFFTLLLISLFFSGCAGSVKHMRSVSEDMAVTDPDDGKALMVFMRPSGIGFAIQSSVYVIEEGEPILVGIVAAKKKVAYQVEPGKQIFMVVGESADFMSADVLPNKTYYALVTPRMGMWKARFSLKPIHNEQLDSTDFYTWLNECEWVVKTPESDLWVMNNKTSIREKHDKYFPEWMRKAPSARPALTPADGI